MLTNIETFSYFRPMLPVARLSSLPQLEELSIEFSTPIPRPSTEMELLGEQRALVTLPSLKILQFKGASRYPESLVAQIRTPLLKQLRIMLFNQIAFALPHLFRLINISQKRSSLPARRLALIAMWSTLPRSVAVQKGSMWVLSSFVSCTSSWTGKSTVELRSAMHSSPRYQA